MGVTHVRDQIKSFNYNVNFTFTGLGFAILIVPRNVPKSISLDIKNLL